MNLDNVFRETADRQREHPAIVTSDGPPMSYRDLDDAIEAAAVSLRRAGVGAGACVGLHLPSGWKYIVLNYAIWRCRACVVPIADGLTAVEKHEIFREIAMDWVISGQHQADHVAPLHRGEMLSVPFGCYVAPTRWFRDRPAGFDCINAAFIRFTSGTTGTSKGVVLSHETIGERIRAANQPLRIGPSDRILWLLPMAYHFAVSIVCYLSFGATILLPANSLPPAIIDGLVNNHATLIYASPAHYALIVDSPPAQPQAGLRLAISTTSSLDVNVGNRFHRQWGVPVSQALGVIEIGLPCMNLEFAVDKPRSVGQVIAAYQLRMEDAGLGPKSRLVAFRGPGFLDAYYHPWRSREEIVPEGWFRTGDIGELDADGCLYLRGRSNDVINVMGMKFFPQEVEAVLLLHPQVVEACVFARPHDRLGEMPCARVRARRGADSSLPKVLRQLCERHLASFKVPLVIELVNRLPRTASGKMLRRDVVGR